MGWGIAAMGLRRSTLQLGEWFILERGEEEWEREVGHGREREGRVGEREEGERRASERERGGREKEERERGWDGRESGGRSRTVFDTVQMSEVISWEVFVPLNCRIHLGLVVRGDQEGAREGWSSFVDLSLYVKEQNNYTFSITSSKKTRKKTSKSQQTNLRHLGTWEVTACEEQ